jgi:Ca2+-binding EF-hand superfamily protein
MPAEDVKKPEKADTKTDTASKKDDAKAAASDAKQEVSTDVTKVSNENEGELASENLLPEEAAFDPVTDMDAPKQPRKFSQDPSRSPVASPSEAPQLPVGASGKRRFRKRSVNITTLPDDQLKAVEAIFDDIDKEKTGFISRKDVATVLKENYHPSDREVQEVMRWLGDDTKCAVSFNEYSVAMATSMTNANLNDSTDIETARAALSAEMVKLGKDTENVEKILPTDENVKNARTVIGETNIAHMEARFKGLDTDGKGFLNQDEVKELVRLTYVAPEENINTFMKFFHENSTEAGISREEFKHGLTLLYGDFTFVLKAQANITNVLEDQIQNGEAL